MTKPQTDGTQAGLPGFMSRPELDDSTFEKFVRLIHRQAGIKLGPHKRALVCARVGKRMRQLGTRDFRDYYRMVEEDTNGDELVELLNAISTNTTHFFRESRHFELLAQLFEKWSAEGQSRFRVWSAASSTGEEPYSIAMTLKDVLTETFDTKILATDISTRVLQIAKSGLYEPRHIEKVSPFLIDRYFERKHIDDRLYFQVTPSLRRMIKFARLNLSVVPFPMRGPLDVIFCRNVMIYFDNDVRRRLLNEMYRLLKPGGYLMVGHAESLCGMLSNFKSVEPSVYIKQ